MGLHTTNQHGFLQDAETDIRWKPNSVGSISTDMVTDCCVEPRDSYALWGGAGLGIDSRSITVQAREARSRTAMYADLAKLGR
jgi:hypothetical protein